MHLQQENAVNHGLVGYWDFGESKHPFCQGADHQGGDWTPRDGEVISGVHCNISRFIIPEFTTVSVAPWDGSTDSGKVEIFARVSVHTQTYYDKYVSKRKVKKKNVF